jgi:hypothetical protein
MPARRFSESGLPDSRRRSSGRAHVGLHRLDPGDVGGARPRWQGLPFGALLARRFPCRGRRRRRLAVLNRAEKFASDHSGCAQRAFQSRRAARASPVLRDISFAWKAAFIMTALPPEPWMLGSVTVAM